MKAAVLFTGDLEVKVEVLEVFKQDAPLFIDEGQEISVKRE